MRVGYVRIHTMCAYIVPTMLKVYLSGLFSVYVNNRTRNHIKSVVLDLCYTDGAKCYVFCLLDNHQSALSRKGNRHTRGW